MKIEAYENGVVIVTLCDKASKNTFSEAFIKGVIEVFEHTRNTPRYKVVVLTGFDHYFICGGTKQELLTLQEGGADFSDMPLYELPLNCEIPVIAAMQGHALGAGWAMGMLCDLTIFSEESVYSSRFMQFGFTPGFGSTLVFPHYFGKDLGHEILFTAREYKGRELKKRGMKMRVLPRSEVQSHAIDLANRMALSSRKILVKLKTDRSRNLRDHLETTLAQEVAMHKKAFVGNQEVLERIQRLFNDGGGIQENESQKKLAFRSEEVQSEETDEMLFETVLKKLRETLAEELSMQAAQVDDEAAFIEMGLDSISSATWMRQVSDHYGVSMAAPEVYNHPTLIRLTKHVIKKGKEQGCFASTKKATSIPISSKKKLHGDLVDPPQRVFKPREIQSEETDETLFESVLKKLRETPSRRAEYAGSTG